MKKKLDRSGGEAIWFQQRVEETGNEGGVTENVKGCKSQRTADVQGCTRPELGGDDCTVRVTQRQGQVVTRN